MTRRTFAAALPALAAGPHAEVALITHADGPHLSGYIDGLAKTPEVGNVYLCDPTAATEAAVRKGLGGKLSSVYKSPAALFAAQKPPLALITMEAGLAPPAIHAALDANCHVMAEKPACVRFSDFAPLAAKAKQRNRHLMLALANRVDPVVQEALRIVRSGSIGKIFGCELHIIADQTRLGRPGYHNSWTAKKARAGGGHLIWLGIHWIDLAMYLTGSRIRQVAGFTSNVGGQPLDIEDSAVVAMRFDNGTNGTLTSAYFLDRGYHSFIKIWGSQGWLCVQKHTDNPLEWYTNSEKKIQRYTGPLEPSGYTPFVGHVVRASLGAAPPLTTDDSVLALKAVFAAYRAAESGATQDIS